MKPVKEVALQALVVLAMIAAALFVGWLMQGSGPNDNGEPRSWGEYRWG